MLLSLLLACQDISLVEQKEYGLIVAPDILEFGHLLSGHESDSKSFTIANASSDEVVVDHLEMEGDNFTIVLDGFTVEAGGWTQVEVGYTPVSFEHNEGIVDIYLQGEEGPDFSVLLDGYGDAPLLTVNPTDVDFGTPTRGCEISQEVHIQNDGNVDLIIDDISFMTNLPQEINLRMGSLPPFPWELNPNDRVALWVDYSPIDDQGDTMDWEITSNDPDNPVYNASAIGNGVLTNEMTHHWTQPTQPKIDLIWIIDNSNSMLTWQTRLGVNMASFMNTFLLYVQDYQIAFITTDDPTFVGSSIDSNTGDPLLQSISRISSIGTGGNGVERGIENLRVCIDIGDCKTWLRHNSELVAIFVSDEPDQSLLPTNVFINFFDSIRPNAFTPFGIIGDLPNGCGGPAWPAQPGWGYWQLIDHYSSQWWSLCDLNWGDQMEEVAQSIALQSIFPLQEPDPVIDSIEVWVNGQINEDWEYDASNNSVTFDFEVVPGPGDNIEVSYSYWGCSGE
jgi:hypothetical protein